MFVAIAGQGAWPLVRHSHPVRCVRAAVLQEAALAGLWTRRSGVGLEPLGQHVIDSSQSNVLADAS